MKNRNALWPAWVLAAVLFVLAAGTAVSYVATFFGNGAEPAGGTVGFNAPKLTDANASAPFSTGQVPLQFPPPGSGGSGAQVAAGTNATAVANALGANYVVTLSAAVSQAALAGAAQVLPRASSVPFAGTITAPAFVRSRPYPTDLPIPTKKIPWLTANPTYRPNCWISYNDYRGNLGQCPTVGGVTYSFGPVADPARNVLAYTNMGNYYYGYITNLAVKWLNDGMYAAGFRTIWLDDGWQDAARDAGGDLTWNPATMSNGIPALTAYLHELGYKVIIYTAYGPSSATTCGGFPGTTDFTIQRDFNTFAAWDVDGVMMDACRGSNSTNDGGGMLNDDDPPYAYARHELASLERALANVSPPHSFYMIPTIPVWPPPPEYPLYAQMGNSWGAYPWGYPTITPTFDDLEAAVAPLRFISTNALLWDCADYVQFGESMGEGCFVYDANLARAQLSMCAMACSPMRTSGGLDAGGQFFYYTNQNVISLICDPYAKCGTEIYSNNNLEVFARPIGYTGSGTNLLAFYNSGSTAQTFTLTNSVFGARANATLSWMDLWAGTNLTFINTNFTLRVQATSIMLFKEWADSETDQKVRFTD